MRRIIIFCVFGVAAVAYAKTNSDYYTDKYDNFDLDEVINNRRLLIPYLNCMLDKGKCTRPAKELKSHIKDALETDCAKCTVAQRNGISRVFAHLIKHEPDYWNQLKAKYDSSGKYFAKHENRLNALLEGKNVIS